MDEKIEQAWWSRGRIQVAVGGIILIILISLIASMIDESAVLRVDKDKLLIGEVEEKLFQEFIQVTGSIQPARSNFIDAVEGGVIESIRLPSGTTVAAGDTILTLSNSSLRLQVLRQSSNIYDQMNQARNSRLNIEQNTLSLKERLAQAENQYRLTGANFRRIDTLYSRQLVSEQTYTEARENHQYQEKRYDLIYESFRQDSIQSEQQLLQIDESLERMQQSLTAVQDILDRLVITAPIPGQLSTSDLTVGQSITAGQRIGQIDRLDRYKITALIDEYYLSRISEGLDGTARIDERVFPVEMSTIFPIVNNGQFEVEMQFTGRQPDKLKRGQTLRIRLELGNSSSALVLERGAFFNQTGGNWVFRLSEDGTTASRQAIELGRQNPEYFEISAGISAGDKIILSDYESFGDRETLRIE
jgi:HlyD family secretion protein